jgi:hypothetical protein
MTGALRPLWVVALVSGLLLGLWPSRALAGPEPFPDLSTGGGRESVSSVWFDGRDKLYAATFNAAHVLKRGGNPRSYPVELEVIEDADGYWAGVDGVVVLVNRDGWLGRYQGVGWELERAPLLEGDNLAAVAVDGNQRIYCVGSQHAMYVREGEEFQVVPYPEELTVRPLAAASSPGGQVFIVGRDGIILHYDGRGFERKVVVGLTAYSVKSPWYSAWYSADSDNLWVRAGKDRLLAIDVDTGTATEYHIPVVDLDASTQSAGFTAIDGVATATGDRLVLALGRAVYVFEKGRFRHVSTESRLIYDMAIVHDEDAVYVATQDGLVRRSLQIPTENRPMQQLTETERRRLQELERRERRVAARNWDKFWAPSLRAATGPSWHFGAPRLAAPVLDLGLGVMMTPVQKTSEGGPTFWVWPEALYTYDSHRERGGHMASLGVGLGWGTHLIAGYYTPRFAVGTSGQNLTAALRHGLSAQALWGVVGVGVDHQVNFTNQGEQHELRLIIGINFAPLIWLASVAREQGDGRP